MRKKYFTFLPLAAMLAFCGCSNEEEVIGNDANPGTTAKECGYIAVNIVQPADRGAKTGETDPSTNPSFEGGTVEENQVTDATFFVFNSDGQCTTATNMKLGGSTSGNVQGNPSTEKLYNAVIVVKLDKNGQKYSGEIFCVLNSPKIKDLVDTQSANTFTKDNLREMVVNSTKKDDGTFIVTNDDGTIIMTNSVYKDGENEICGATFTTDNFKDTQNEASEANNRVDIYVERVAAKVRTKQSGINAETPLSDVSRNSFNGENVDGNLVVRITGLGIANIATSAYLFKNTTTKNNSLSWPTASGVNETVNKRCYWEYVPFMTNETVTTTEGYAGFYNKSYNKIINDTYTHTEGTVDNELTNWVIGEYILPNTSDPKYSVPESATDHPGANTSVIVTAQILQKSTDGTKYTPASLVWLTGAYYTDKAAKNEICTHLQRQQYYIKYTDKNDKKYYESITPDLLKWSQGIQGSDLKSYQAVAQVDGNALTTKTPSSTEYQNEEITERKIVKYDGTKEILNGDKPYSIDDVNKHLAGENTYYAEVFTDGMCYYFAPIDQTLAIIGATGPNYGVVRNHIYELNLSKISGIGTAIFDPTVSIIPETPDHKSFGYLAATVNVLSWRLVSQDVEFNGQK